MKKIKEQAPQSAQFELFFQKVKAEKFETFLPSVTNYVQLKQAAGLYDPLSMAAVKDASMSEYYKGWDGIESILKALWNKFLGNKFASQELADFVFMLLFSGVEKGWQAVKNAVGSHLGKTIVDDVVSIVAALNQIFFQGKGKQLMEDIQYHRNQLDVVEQEPKLTFWQKLLRGVSVVLRLIVGKS